MNAVAYAQLQRLLAEMMGYAPVKLSARAEAVLNALAASAGLKPDELILQLDRTRDADTLAQVVEAFTVQHTCFFRHAAQFEQIADYLLQKHHNLQRELLVWSAGCATGEEVYSLAIRAEEVGVPLRILGTDISRNAIETARAGRYEAYPGPLGRTGRWAAPEALKHRIHFELSSIVGDRPTCNEGPFDLILCRNVLIYFDWERCPTILEQLRSHLQPAGAIVLSPADAVLPIPQSLKRGKCPGWLSITRRPSLPPAPEESRSVSHVRKETPLESAARLVSSGDNKCAERILTKVLNHEPDRVSAWFLLGEALAQRNERAQAAAAFSRAARVNHREIDPEIKRLQLVAVRRAKELKPPR